jgi:predicted metal-dependent HD superfamily phosphohydrolase
MTDYAAINKKSEHFVTGLFEEKKPNQLHYHSLQHTRNIVSRAREIASHYRVTDEEMMIVTIAAWFHDIGYLFGGHENHEQRGVEVMREFVSSFDMPESQVSKIASCIMATKQPTHPAGLLEEILCDADTYHFGTKEFKTTNKQFYEECNLCKDNKIAQWEYNKAALQMLEQHRFYTAYCRELLDEYKKENMKRLRKKVDKHEINEPDEKKAVQETIDIISEKDGTTKGMQTLLRLTSSNHIQLSEMADSKANILISVNAIIISVILSVLIRKLQTDPYLTIPTIIFLLSSVCTIVIAILATRPKLNNGIFKEEDVEHKRTNLLFFGNFHRMSLVQYEKAMRMMMKDADYLYTSIIQDIYYLGVVLGRKYRLIRLAYNVFMVGIIVSVIAFAAASFFSTDSTPVTIIKGKKAGSPF